jgi:DNA-binding CsgD family transcriptional regulator
LWESACAPTIVFPAGGVGVGVGVGAGVGVGTGVGVGVGFGAACTMGNSATVVSVNRTITAASDLFFIGLEVGFALDFPVFPFFLEYAEMRTKVLDCDKVFSLRKGGPKSHMSPPKQAGLRARVHGVEQGIPAFSGRLALLGLTQREAEVLAWIAKGKGNYEIGVILGARTRTICKHVEHIFRKLDVENRTAAAAIAFAVSSQLLDFL